MVRRENFLEWAEKRVFSGIINKADVAICHWRFGGTSPHVLVFACLRRVSVEVMFRIVILWLALIVSPPPCCTTRLNLSLTPLLIDTPYKARLGNAADWNINYISVYKYRFVDLIMESMFVTGQCHLSCVMPFPDLI